MLLQGLCSRSGPLHCVLYEAETQKRVRLCQPSPHVAEHTLHGDHSSPTGESTGVGWGRGIGDGVRKRQVHKGQEERAEKNSGIQHAGAAVYAHSEQHQDPQAFLNIQCIHLQTG